MTTIKLNRQQKAAVFDWIISKFEDNELEMLFTDDHTGESAIDTVCSLQDLIYQCGLQVVYGNQKPPKHIKLTPKEFNNIREEIYSSYSQAGSMDELPQACAEKAFDSVCKAEKRNDIEPLSKKLRLI